MTTFTIGADPEIFLTNKATGAAISAHDLLPGTKAIPHKVEFGAVQVDGTAAEFNIDPVRIGDFNGFNNNIIQVMKQLSQMVGKQYSFNLSPVQEYPKDYFDSLPPSAVELGCDPDYSAYTGKVNPRPDNTKTFRTAAGHIHVGWGSNIPKDDEDHMLICCEFIKMLDVTAGLFNTLIDGDPRRRELYGKAGAFRPKSYGVEYRTPSNRWLATKNTRFMMWWFINEGVKMMTEFGSVAKVGSSFGINVGKNKGKSYLTAEQVEEIINTDDRKTAREILDVLIAYRADSATKKTFLKAIEEMNDDGKTKKDEANG